RLFGHGARFFGAGGAGGQVVFGLRDLFHAMGLLGIPFGDLLLELVAARLQAIARFDDVADLGFQAADLGIGLVQLALRGVHGIAGGVVRLPARFELGLAGTQAGDRGFQIVLGLGDFLVFTLALFARAGFFQQPQGKLLFLAIGLQFAVLPRHFGLRLELFQLAAQLAQDVLDAGEVLARVGQAVLGFAAALFISRHAGGLFQEHAQFFGARLDQAVDHALPDNGVTPGAQAGAQENIVDIPAPHLLIVDVIAAGAVARQYAAHRDFGIGAPLAGRAAFAVVENHFDRRARRRL